MPYTLPVFFNACMVAPNATSFSPSAAKPTRAVADWQAHNLPISLHDFLPASRDQLALAHDLGYVNSVLSLAEPNGFNNKDPEVAASLPWTTGALMAAAEHALLSDDLVTCAPVSGFHHAGYDGARGYCTFNGLMVTACYLLKLGMVNHVSIVDFDFHYGDGTDEIIQRRGLRSKVWHYTSGHIYERPDQADEFLRAVPQIMVDAIKAAGPKGIVLYQAGADMHRDDPLGGMLSTEQLNERDRLVFEAVRRAGMPCAFDLAGGYQRDKDKSIEPVLAIHRNSVRRACEQLT